MTDETNKPPQDVQTEKSVAPEYAGIYTSRTPELRFQLNGKRTQFKNGVFYCRTNAEVMAMEAALAGMSPSARALIQKVDYAKAEAIVHKHQAALKNAAAQGPFNTLSAKQALHGATSDHDKVQLATQGVDPSKIDEFAKAKQEAFGGGQNVAVDTGSKAAGTALKGLIKGKAAHDAENDKK